MIFNLWRPYKWIKPKESNWYLCTVQHGAGYNSPKVMELYFREYDRKWINLRRQRVFDGYNVYESGHAVIEDYRVFSDVDCIRTDILAWKKLPKRWHWWKKKEGVSNE